MSIEEVRQSGLLELYVMGELSHEEEAQVIGFVKQYPQLKDDLNSIEQALEVLATSAAVVPPKNILDDTLSKARDIKSDDEPKSRSWSWLPVMVGLLTLGLGYLSYKYYQEAQTSLTKWEDCKKESEEAQRKSKVLIELYDAALDSDSKQYNLSPTANFKSAKATFYFNQKKKQNYIRTKELPAINKDQVYQLWSLKEAGPPIPMTTFTGDNAIVALDFEEGTKTYAFTVEPKGGSQAPTMDKLFGTVTLDP